MSTHRLTLSTSVSASPYQTQNGGEMRGLRPSLSITNQATRPRIPSTSPFWKGKAPVVACSTFRSSPSSSDVGCSYWTVASTLHKRSFASNVPGSTSDRSLSRHEQSVGLFDDSDPLEHDDSDHATHEKDTSSSSKDDAQPATGHGVPRTSWRPQLPTSQKKLNRLLSRHVVHAVPEDELEEQFLKGTGPGGQAINKTNSAVSLFHKPTGIRIKAQPTRSREKNREAARKILRQRLDDLRAKGLYPPPSDPSAHTDLAEEIIVNPGTPLDLDVDAGLGERGDSFGAGLATGSGTEQVGKKLDKQSRKDARKSEEIALAGSYSQSELRAAKIRARKANKAKKSKKAKREREAAAAQVTRDSAEDGPVPSEQGVA